MIETAAAARMPYPGLRAFRREESDLFFGREDCISAMVDRLAATRFLGVLGSSGTGKSSLVRTGLLDALDLGIMAERGSSWRVVDFRPGSAPLANLARRLLETDPSQPPIGVADADVDLLRAFLVRGPRSIVEWCGDGHLKEPTSLLLLVDQFEELFRYQDYAGREEAEAFAALLLESARSTRFPIYVALTMRSEYLGACALIEGLAEAISAGIFLTPRMTREQCRAAIVGPAGVCGVKIEGRLVSRLLNDLAAFAPWDDRSSRDQLGRLVRRADQLPLLQYCLNRMFVRAKEEAHDGAVTLTLADYERIGGLSGALNAHAEEILHSFDPARQAVAASVFRALAEGSTIADAVRRPTRLGELTEIAGADSADVRAVVDAFRAPGCNFLTPELDPQEPRPLDASTVVDISHESLIRQWKRMSDWLDKEARSVRQWRRLKDLIDDGRLMGATELTTMRAWLREERPNAAWIRRHGGDLSATVKFVQRSAQRQGRFAPLMMPAVFAVMMALGLFAFMGLMFWIDPSNADNTEKWPWPVTVAWMSTAVGLACAVGLTLYRGFEPRRIVLAAAGLIVLNGLSGALLVYSLITYRGMASGPASFNWYSFLLAPFTMTGLAIFDRAFRRPLPWVLLVALAVISMRGEDLMVVSKQVHGYLALLAWLIWFAGIGFQLKNGEDFQPSERWRSVAFLQLPLLAVVSLITIFVCLAPPADRASLPSWSWLFEIPITLVPLSLACGVGLWRFAGFRPGRAVLAALSIFAIEYASGAALVALLLSRGMPLQQTYLWWTITTYAPGVLLGLALFEPSFRRTTTWLPLAALFAGLSAIWLWLKFYMGASDAAQGWFSLAMYALWIAAIGYLMQKEAAAKAIGRERPA